MDLDGSIFLDFLPFGDGLTLGSYFLLLPTTLGDLDFSLDFSLGSYFLNFLAAIFYPFFLFFSFCKF